MTSGMLHRERFSATLLFAALLIAYGYIFPRWADPNQDSRLKMIIAVVDDGTFMIDKYLGTTVDYAKVDGHYYSDKAPGVAFLGIPIYAGLRNLLALPLLDRLTDRLANSSAFQATLRPDGTGIVEQKVRFALAQVVIALCVGAFPTALLGVLLFRWLASLTSRLGPRLVVALGYGLLTPAFAYANTMYGHQLSAALLFGAFYWVSMARKPLSLPALLGVGVLLSYAVVTEYPAALLTGLLYLYTAYRLYRLDQWRGLMWVTFSAALVAAGWMAYNDYIFGGPLNLGYEYSELWQTQHQTGFMSLSLPHPDALWGITFGLFRGLFVLAPWLLLAAPGFWLWWRSGERRAEWVVALAGVIGIYLFNSSSVMWWGGFAVGPRYLLPALPFLTLPIGFVFREWGRTVALKIVAGLLLAWSFVATWGLTLAEQAFPSDAISNPLLAYALPNWLAGNIARNVGTLLGLHGALSLVPLLILLTVIGGGGWLVGQWGTGRLEQLVAAARPRLVVKS